MTPRVKWSFSIFGVMLLVTISHYLTPAQFYLSHEILERLYYLPIVIAALYFGWVGGLLAAGCAGLCYAPFIFLFSHDSPQVTAGRYAEIIVFLAVGALTGALSDRERKRRRELQRATDQLSETHRQLQNSIQQLRRADRLSAVGQLAASLAHEIRNPLGSIEGAVDIVERTTDEERRREFLGIIKKETRRLNGLLTNLLDFSRPRIPQIRAAHVDAIVRTVIDLTAHNALQQGIQLELHITPELPPVECDPEQIIQVLLNVTLNAIQASPAGGQIAISVDRRENMILMRISDQGSGIAETELDKIFDPFYTTKESGTGLGLAVSYQILAQHGGGIAVERNPDKGMTFTLSLPIRHVPTQNTQI
ncbi:MAG: ATP-binding protein [Acidobacteriota bacterium]